MKQSYNSEEGQAANTIMIAVGIVLIAALVIWVLSQRNTTVNINDAAQGGSPTITTIAGQGDDTSMMNRDGTVSIMDLMNNPDQYYGQSVTVEGEIDSVESEQAFVLDQQGTIIGDEVLVLYSTTPAGGDSPNPFANEDRVQVSGTVQRLSEVDAIYTQGLSDAMRNDYADKPVIVATTVTLMSGMSGTPADQDMMEEESGMTSTPSPTMSR
jgi:hypothetical protein